MNEENVNTFLKYLALYLPQYHSIPENDIVWGKGFTEWTNVRPAKPLFKKHYQPHIPHKDIGYYCLDDISVMINQAKIAKKYGIYGFCYYYYWFSGKTLLEKPLKQMLAESSVDIPFCLLWTNHNWTKVWDAGNKEVIIEQVYDSKDYTKFIDDLYPYFKDSRYIRINNSPLLLIYDIDALPDPLLAVKTWRDYSRKKYGTELYLILGHQKGDPNPIKYNCNAAVEFTPNYLSWQSLSCNTPKLLYKKTRATFYDYFANIGIYVLKKCPDYKLFRCVYPTWDNTARRKKDGSWMFLGFTLQLFKKFLEEMSKITVRDFPKEERFVFINAWNEWAEGCHLEPDTKYGYKFLETCCEVINMNLERLKREGFSIKEKEKMKKRLLICNEHYNLIKFKLLGLIPALYIKFNDSKYKVYCLGVPVLYVKKYSKNSNKIINIRLFGIQVIKCHFTS
ncbi:MAG: glycoside hydrolase family 99-like domain-containing protein [Endomicrobium sp.]|jgi:hypothetical protein|nr:glycoside hydrolase family 99-like domain-containing protein [Endomicrobium sp.]